MGRIDQDYGNNSPVLSTDKVIGTNTAGETKNFTADELKDYVLTGGATGSFTAQSGETVTVVNGIITSIV